MWAKKEVDKEELSFSQQFRPIFGENYRTILPSTVHSQSSSMVHLVTPNCWVHQTSIQAHKYVAIDGSYLRLFYPFSKIRAFFL